MWGGINCSEISKSNFSEEKKSHYSLSSERKNCSSKELSFEEETKCQFSLVMSLIDLQLYCTKCALDELEIFPFDQREYLYKEILVRLIRLKHKILRRSPQELKTISLALLDYHETMNKAGSFNSDLAEAVFDHYRHMASYIEEDQGNRKIRLENLLLDKTYHSDNEEIKEKRLEGRIDEYLRLRKNSNSLYLISEGIDSILSDIPSLYGEENKLAVQEALRISGEYLKSSPPTNTPNIDEPTMFKLREGGVPVEELRRFRDMMTHKQLLPLLTLEEAETIAECLPALKYKLDNEIHESEHIFIVNAIDKALLEIDDEEFKERMAQDIVLDITREQNIPTLKGNFDRLRESDIYQKLSDAHRALLDAVYEKMEEMNSKNFSCDFEEVPPIKEKILKSLLSLKEIIKVGTKDAQGNVLEVGKESHIKKQLADIISKDLEDKPSPDILNLIVNRLFTDAAVEKGKGRYFEEKSLKNYLIERRVAKEVSEKIASNIGNHYVSKIRDEFHTLKKLNNNHALRSQLIKLYDSLERYSNFKGLNEIARKVKLARNFLSHGDSLMNFSDNVLISEKVIQLIKEQIIEDLDIRLLDQVLKKIDESEEEEHAKDRLAEKLIEKFEQKLKIVKLYSETKSERESLQGKLEKLSNDIDALKKPMQNETREEITREKEIDRKVTELNDLKLKIERLSEELNDLQEVRNNLEKDLQKPELTELRRNLETSVISKVVNLSNVEKSIESISDESALKTVLGVVQALICGDGPKLPHSIVKRMAGASAHVHSSTHEECIEWKEIDKFNVLADDSRTPYDLQEDQYYEPMEYDNFDSVPINRNPDDIIVDSEKFIAHIDNLFGENLRNFHNRVVLASESEVVGKSKDIVGQLVSTYRKHSKLERLGRISGHINQGLMAKDIIDDILAGDYKDAAINAAFFVSGHGLSAVSNLASMKGVSYMSEGKALFGKSLKLGSPFVSRMTSAFVAYDLYNQVKEYTEGNNDAILPIIGNSIQLSLDAVSLGVEVGDLAGFSALEATSAVLGPVGETIGLLVYVGEQIYSAVKTVEKIDENIHLTGMERFVEGFKAFLKLGIKEGLDIALEEKNLNNRAVKDIVGFLKNNSHIKRAIFPSMKVDQKKMYNSEILANILYVGIFFTAAPLIARVLSSTFDLKKTCFPVEKIVRPHSDVEVFLDKKVGINELKWIKEAPGEPGEGKIYFAINDKSDDGSGITWLKGNENELIEGKLVCIPSTTEEGAISSSEKTYKSKNAIGVKYRKDRDGKATFINLTEGRSTIVAFRNKPNIFAIGHGCKDITGGESDDLFKFVDSGFDDQSPYITGVMDGLGGTDTLDIDALPSQINNIFMNFQEKYLRDTDDKLSLEVKNINNFIGRVSKIDTVNAACDTRHIDAKGGVSDSNYETITITDSVACNYDTKVIIRPYTKVNSKPQEGAIRYIINEKEIGTASVNIDSNSKCNHLFIFAPYTLDDISSIQVQESRISFSFSVSRSEFKLFVNGSPTTYGYQLSGSTKLIVGQKNLYALHNTQESIDRSSIERYSNIAKNLKMNLVVHSNEEVLSVGHDHHDVIQNDPTAKVSHLVANGGDNIFILKSGNDVKNLPLAGVVLYNFNRGEATRDTLDLREINKQVKELFNEELKSDVIEIGKDLEVTLSTQSAGQIIKIRLKDALENHWYKMLDILINGLLIIEKTDTSYELSPQKLIFSDTSKSTYVITSNDVESENSIEIRRSIGNYAFARDDNSLVITSDLQSSTDEPSTVLLHNFYTIDKMNTLSIKFDDKEVVLTKQLNRIMELNDKNDFRDKIEQFRTNGYRSAMDDVYGRAVRENIDLTGNLLLLNLLIGKLSGKNFVYRGDESISEEQAMACAMSITHEFEKVLKKAAKASKTKLLQEKLGYELYKEAGSTIKATIVRGEHVEIENILHSAAEYVCPEGNEEFVKLVDIEIKNMLDTIAARGALEYIEERPPRRN